MKTTIAIDIDTDALRGYEDSYLAQLWHIAQANPAPYDDMDAGVVVEQIGFEIIRRFLATTPPDLYAHQVRSAFNGRAVQARPLGR